MKNDTLIIYAIPALQKVTATAIKDWNRALAGRAEFILAPGKWIGRYHDIVIDYGITNRSTSPDRVAQATRSNARGPMGTFTWSIVLDTRVKWSVSGWQRFWGLSQNNALSAILHELGHTLLLPHSDVAHHVMHHSLGTTYLSAEEAASIRQFWDARAKGDDF
ncbi:hypothetical protein UFOVP806_11 [uncultured Caudovirales phage]|uniref:Peptidase M10 metallopeptidase domain-containing protein n=1 Tax=uncultured Caudovirales phage TaxID=2100421 RepID=A0A6J5P205_9CAUD|nr:hypothetical protein UFOVP806_11 [uncultured Caudovirales phage]